MLLRSECSFLRSTIDLATGEFSGYGAVFDNIDSHRDVIERGSFAETLREWRARGRMPRMLLMHGSGGNPFMFDDLPVGRWIEMREDNKGLAVRGQLINLDTDLGRRIRGLMAAGELDGLSIGFNIKRSRPGSGGVKRVIEAVRLVEVSLVDAPSNDLARMHPVQSPSPAAAAVDASFDKLRGALAAIDGAKATATDGSGSTLAERIRRLANG